MEKVSCIICAYNEADRIGTVLSAVADHPDIGEIIVIDDGSVDGTAEKMAGFPNIRLVRHEKNLGKSAAIATGVSHARHEMLLFLDADLRGLEPFHISNLLKPVLTGEADVALSLRKNSNPVSHLIQLDFISGERVIPKRILIDKLDEIRALPCFGFETYINRIIIENGLSVVSVYWNAVRLTSKRDKHGQLRGFLGNMEMIRQILEVAPLNEVIYQNYAMSRLASAQKEKAT